jgi:hypothetical protein
LQRPALVCPGAIDMLAVLQIRCNKAHQLAALANLQAVNLAAIQLS